MVGEWINNSSSLERSFLDALKQVRVCLVYFTGLTEFRLVKIFDAMQNIFQLAGR